MPKETSVTNKTECKLCLKKSAKIVSLLSQKVIGLIQVLTDAKVSLSKTEEFHKALTLIFS